MKKHLTLAMIGMVGLGGVALAQRPEPAPPGPPKGRAHPSVSMMKDELGLTDEQASQLRKLHNEQRRAAIRRRADLRIARMDLDELMNAASVDEKALSAKMKEIGDLEGAALKARVDSRLALRKVLTPDQLAKMKEMRPAPGRERGFRGRQGRPPMRPGPGGGGLDDAPEDGPDEEP